MEKLTLGLEIEFQAHVAMWLLFYKNAQEKSQKLPGPCHLLPALTRLRVTGRRALGFLPQIA